MYEAGVMGQRRLLTANVRTSVVDAVAAVGRRKGPEKRIQRDRESLKWQKLFPCDRVRQGERRETREEFCF
jgi:hypothetical protein